MNIVEAELFLDGKTLKAKLNERDDQIVKFPEIKAKQLSSKRYIGQKVLLGIRPEHLIPNDGDISVFVDVVEHLGDETIMYTKMDNRKEQFIIKTPFNSKMHSNESIRIKFDMNRVYLFDKETHKAIIGIPHEDEIPIIIKNNVLSIGGQDLVLDEEYASHLLDSSFDSDVFLGIKPDYISMEELPNSLKITAKLEFIEQKTDYQAVYFSLKGIDGYFAMKVKNDEKVELGKEVQLYLPYQRINVYDQNHNKTNSREVVLKNDGVASVKNVNGEMKVTVAGSTLSYPSDGSYPDGNYKIVFKKDKLQPIFNKKMQKAGYTNPEVEDGFNRIKVSAYDEDVLGSKLLVYVEVPGFEKYTSFVVENNFSVYKMPKFELYVPIDGFELLPLE